jgi:hypothetical protein
MAEQPNNTSQPNDASRKDKAEGERWSDESSEDQSGITSRSVDEAASNQEDDGDRVMPSNDATVNTKI